MVGSTISGVFAAGGRTGSIGFFGFDRHRLLNRPAAERRQAAVVRTDRAAEADLHDRFRRLVLGAEPPRRHEHEHRDQRDWAIADAPSIELRPSPLSAARDQDFADGIHRVTAAAPSAPAATMPTFSMPASFSRPNTSISSCSCTAPSPRR